MKWPGKLCLHSRTKLRKTCLKVPIFSVVMFLVFILHAYKSQATDSTRVTQDTAYYSSLSKMLSVYLYGYTRFSQLELTNDEGNASLDYQPNENFKLGLGFSYRWIGLSVAFNFKFINNDDDLFGHSTNVDLQTEITTRKTLWNGGLQSFKGYYLDNIDDYIKNWNTDDSVPVRPDITTFSLAVNGIYVMNHNKFSFKAAYSNSEWQHRTAGSWLFGGYFAAYGVSGDSSLIPHNLVNNFPVFDSLQTLGSFTLGGIAGYTRTWVFHDHFFVNAALLLGIAFQASEATDIRDEVLFSEITGAPKTHFRLAIGYNSEKAYGGISVVSDSFLTQHKNSSTLNYNYGLVRLYYGRRFSISMKQTKK